jgi:hypothetical protein
VLASRRAGCWGRACCADVELGFYVSWTPSAVSPVALAASAGELRLLSLPGMGGVDIGKIVRQGRNDILAGCLAGSACKLVEYPLDTIKVQMQTAGSGTRLSTLGPIGLLRMNVREHGFRRLYQGISSPLLGSMAENATLFVSFNLAQSLCHDGPKETMPVHKLVVCAMASGVAVSTVLTPVELIKCRMQTLATDAVRSV